MDWCDIWKKKNDAIYDYEYNGYKFKNQDEYKIFISEICKNLTINNNTNILDICCGNGTFINEFIKSKNIKNVNINGIDISEINIKYAKEHFNGNYLVGDIKKKLPYDDNLFDYVIIVSSLQYLDDNQQLFLLLSEMKRVCKNDGILFFGNIYDKKLCSDIFIEKNHYMFEREILFDYFKNYNIVCYDNKYLDLNFYMYSDKKFNMIIHFNNNLLNIGIDIHDTLTYNPIFFKNLLGKWKGKRILITGTPLSKESEIIELLKNINFFKNIDYDKIEFGYEYEKNDMNYNHFEKMKVHKLNAINNNNIQIYFDDNPFYVEYLRNYVCVYQTILSNNYIDIFNKIDKYFTCNLQEQQFDYLNLLVQKKNVLIPGCFDLFHIGHLNLLNKYVKYNLFIAVQSSQSMYEKKNIYPILNTDERIEFIKNLNIAKDVISYTNLNLINIIKKFKINMLVIGPEYGNCEEHIITLDYCKNNHIEIIVEQRTENISTTIIKNKTQNKIINTNNTIGFVIPNIKNLNATSLLNVYNYMNECLNKFNPIIISENIDFSNKYKDMYKIINITEKLNFDSLNLKYIFFLTPYQQHYKFNFKEISNKVKIIYVSYGYNTWGTINNIVFNHNFFENVYMSFHESESNKTDFVNYAKKSKLQYFNEDNCFVSGCPKIIDDYYNCDNDIKNINNYNIIYNTRWTDDQALTVDIFINGIKKIIQLYSNVRITYRPHPLTKDKIINKIKEHECERFIIDVSDNYEKMFIEYNIMISDASSFMTEFLSTGKPIIYTHRNNVFNTNSSFFEKCYYKVTNEEELIFIMNELIVNKNDYKRDDRIQIINKYFKIYNPCKIISDTIYEDYVSSNINFNINKYSNIKDNKIVKWYDFTGFKTDRPYILYKYLKKYLLNINSILEYGCGHCEVSFKILLEVKNLIYTGVDIDDNLIKKNYIEFEKYNIKNYNFIVNNLSDIAILNKLNDYYDVFAIGGYGNSILIDIILDTINTIKPKYILLETHINRENELKIIKNLLLNENKYKCICDDKFKCHALDKLSTYDYINRVIHIYEKI